MPSLTITAAAKDGTEIVVYQEDVTPIHIDSEHGSRQLMERLRWAVQDAEELSALRAGREARPRRAR